MGLSFNIVYRKGKENAAANALSHLSATGLDEEVVELKRLTSEKNSNWEELIAKENETDVWIRTMKEKIKTGEVDPNFSDKMEFYISENYSV